jgi:hypothetical protein
VATANIRRGKKNDDGVDGGLKNGILLLNKA